jgi:hypothetical protein
MDRWATDEVWWHPARVDGEAPWNRLRFAVYCFLTLIVMAELLYLLITTARHGQRIAPFNFMIPALGCLIVQFAMDAVAMWFAYSDWRPVYLVCITFYTTFCLSPSTQEFSRVSSILPLALDISVLFGFLWP